MIGAVAARLAGSADIYQASGHLPINSTNFVTCHDGFTLNDLVSYNDKHNEANGEDNRDGANDNLSWNCGGEGATDDPAIEALRERQIKNFAVILMMSRGVPMFVAGDEVRRTQKGNNNAYCQDNEISWFDWRLTEENRSLLRFWQLLIAARRDFHSLRAGRHGRFFAGEMNERGLPDIAWHGTELNKPGWDDPNARCLAFTLGGFEGGPADCSGAALVPVPRYGPAFSRGHCRGRPSGADRGRPGAGRGPERSIPAVGLNFTDRILKSLLTSLQAGRERV